jgi:hypothetical protein
MPRVPIDYSKIAIYKLVCNDLNVHNVYVGSTTNMVNRKNTHKFHCMNKSSKGYNQKKYKIMRLNGGWYNWSMILIEYFPCNNKLEASAREYFYIELLNSDMNTQVPGRTSPQYRQDNRSILNEREKVYYKTNKDKILAKQNAKFICECGGSYTRGNAIQHIKTKKHKNYINTNYDYCYQYEDGSPSTEQNYYDSI